VEDTNKNNKNYLNNKDLYEELIACQERGRMSDKLGKMFMLLAERRATHRYFNQYPFKEDLIAAGIMACCNAFMKFKADKSKNPFAFFSSVVYHAFLQTIKKEYAQKNVKDAILVNNNMNPSYGYEERYKEEEDARKSNESHKDEEE